MVVMKIGILTYHRVYNYGAILQAVAMRLYLEKLGNDVYYVNYFPEYHQRMYRPFNLTGFWEKKTLKGKLSCLYHKLRNYNSRKERMTVVDAFCAEHILPYCAQDDKEHFDVIVYGSDQIWRKQPGMHFQYNPVYFGANDYVCDRHVSYAASMGNTHVNSEDLAFLKHHLAMFDAVGVREVDLYELLKPLDLRHLSINVDPTLLLRASEWDKVFHTERLLAEPYALFYKVRDSFTRRALEKYCTAKRLKLVTVNPCDAPRGSDYNPSPAEFVALIKHADVVLTSSFHGLAFSIIYRKEFFVSSFSESERMQNLMLSLGVDGRLLPFGSDIPTDVDAIDFTEVTRRLEVMTMGSERFIDAALHR